MFSSVSLQSTIHFHLDLPNCPFWVSIYGGLMRSAHARVDQRAIEWSFRDNGFFCAVAQQEAAKPRINPRIVVPPEPREYSTLDRLFLTKEWKVAQNLHDIGSTPDLSRRVTLVHLVEAQLLRDYNLVTEETWYLPMPPVSDVRCHGIATEARSEAVVKTFLKRFVDDPVVAVPQTDEELWAALGSPDLKVTAALPYDPLLAIRRAHYRGIETLTIPHITVVADDIETTDEAQRYFTMWPGSIAIDENENRILNLSKLWQLRLQHNHSFPQYLKSRTL